MLNQEQELRFCRARRAVIELDFPTLNPEQRRAALATEGPLLLLAGAGSGKTTVLIHRVANLMKYGRGSDSDEVPGWVTEDDLAFLEAYAAHPLPDGKSEAERLCKLEPAMPWSIIAITFTNKAAGELKERLERMLGPTANDVWASTFHSACVKILRRDIEKLGFDRSFTIYDSADSERVVKDVLKDQRIDDKAFPARSVLSAISRAKDSMLSGPEYLAQCEKAGDFRLTKIAKVYVEYERRLREANALDFDDLILDTVRLLRDFEDVRGYYQNKFRYVLIDEYQDTNNLQYQLAALLAGKWENICVVGDDDQSIYRFRGATIENILSFEHQYQGARVIRLEQNYRSTQNILGASNAVIRNNQGRKGKELWTDHAAGDKVQVYTAMNESDEAQYVAAQILGDFAQGRRWKDHAVLYRMNAQSNQIEQAFKRNGVPYRIIGGTRFFDRAEVKDMLAYLCAVNNPADDLRLVRILNNPPRGIGPATVQRAQAIAAAEHRPVWEVIRNARAYPELQKAAARLAQFADLMSGLRRQAVELPLPDFYEEVVSRTGYAVMLEAKDTVEDRTRLENVRELLTSINSYIEDAEGEPTLAGFLDTIALYTDLDNHDPNEDCVVMMTMHAAKGLEFPVVFVVGVEEGIFPGIRAIGETEEMEEERRLCYVAMTRAKERLHLTCASQRMLFGRTSANRPSRFVGEIPAEYVQASGRSYWSAPDDDAAGRWTAPSTRSPSADRPSAYGAPRVPMGAGSPRRSPSAPRGGLGRPETKAPASLPSFQKGDAVVHKAFGTGMILNVTPMGGDALVEIAFDKGGTKRLMLKSAAQHMSRAE
ncbi:UvrD-helicase domain-containing protein [Intestinimonas massiliensis]|uniref:DNA 3'-5' helicase n=1 Tax=Intestinimonas massiliensis (ex Afouda et al. 2020) TaxID=1673721 RepID=A0ABS9MAV1_9FIRM|nr:UvrD-helicase domain-containing protein [Intestinimonas massiliensis (ex Afouda et al. 2020)]MCG4527586.1 UvrD-helicase domain-containing protein [Intestinimonas massiliensis (ex Afouda et al. 2020)]MCQ4807562.1 UvrD-helicase domain-containing protein [Intestinimonas massiliensis (ex Afouda et al. 2020)]